MYTDEPKLAPGERLSKEAIKVVPTTPRDKLDPMTRINYAKVYTIEHNIKVLGVGKVQDEDIKQLRASFQETFDPLER
jgi:hypothetical protein